jgi:hypothetical protein
MENGEMAITNRAQQSPDDGDIEKALTDYQEGMRLGDGIRAAAGMRSLQSLEGPNLELLIQMFRKDSNLSKYDLYFLKFDKPQDAVSTLPFIRNETLLAAFATGDAEATANAVVNMGKLEGGDLELLAKMIEAHEPLGLPSISFIQRKTGPPVDPLAIKARWLTVYNKFKKIPEYKDTGEKKQRKELVGVFLQSTTHVSRSLLYEILEYFKHPKK